MRKTYGAILLLPALSMYAVSGWAQDAERPSYDFLGISYVYNTVNVDSDDLPDRLTDGSWNYDEGVQLDASYALNDKWLFRGSYYTASGDYKGGQDIDFSTALVSAGILLPTDDAIGIDVSLEYRLDDIEFDNTSDDVDGLGVSFGIRANITERNELGMRFGVYGGDFDESIGITLSYAFNFSERWAITTSYEYSDVGLDTNEKEGYELNKWSLGGRFYF